VPAAQTTCPNAPVAQTAKAASMCGNTSFTCGSIFPRKMQRHAIALIMHAQPQIIRRNGANFGNMQNRRYQMLN
jgi:hypothetical protein